MYPNEARGFSLLEMMVVIFIISLVMSVVIPRITSFKFNSLTDIARDISQDLRKARSLASSQKKISAFYIDLENKKYGLDGQMNRDIPAHIRLSSTSSKSLVDGKVAGFIFFPDSSSSGGTLTVHEGSDSITISIDWLTGRIDIQ